MVLKIRMIAASKKQSKKQKRIQPLVGGGNRQHKRESLRLDQVLKEGKDLAQHPGIHVRLRPVMLLLAGIESNLRIEMRKHVLLDLFL